MQMLSHIIFKDGHARIDGKEHLKAELVARMVVDGDYPVNEVMTHYGLSAAEVHAALTYYYDHRAELDAAHEQTWATIKDEAVTLDAFKAELLRKRLKGAG